MTRFNIGDIIVNPWVSVEYNGCINPMYATVYIGNNTSIDYKGRTHKWSPPKGRWEDKEKWKVIGHYDIFGQLQEAIINTVLDDEKSLNEYLEKVKDYDQID